MRSPATVAALAFTLTATLTILNPTHAAAQSGVNIFGGVVSATVSGDDLDDVKSKVGFAAGIGLNSAMSGGLSFNPEVMYVSKGIKAEQGDGKLHHNYIEVPLMFRYNFPGSSSTQPFLTAGPTVAYAISCKIKESGDSVDCEDVFGNDNGLKKFDFGLAFGAGVTFSKITVAARYDLGLANIQENSDFTSRNRAFMLTLGIGF